MCQNFDPLFSTDIDATLAVIQGRGSDAEQ